MKWFTLISAFVLLNGCAAPTVFLTTERLPETERHELIRVLSESGFRVKTTSNVRIPAEFPDVVVATNPANENPEFFGKLEQAIRKLSFEPITYQKFYQQKHYYKGRNVGLYIRGDAEELILPPVLRGSEKTCNGQRMILEFKGKTGISLDIEEKEITSYAGSYQSVVPDTVYANFKGIGKSVIFRLSKVSVKTYAGMKTADKLVVIKSDNGVLPIGCEFMIIYY